MSLPKTSNKRTRDIQRALHLVAGVLIIAYVYSPLGDLDAFQILVQAVVIPVLFITGVLMWQLPRLRKRLRERKNQGGDEVAR